MNGNNFARFLHEQLHTSFESEIFRDITFYKFLTVVFLLLLIAVLKSAEMLKYPSLFSTLAILISLFVFWGLNLANGAFRNFKNVDVAEWGHALPLVASQVYSIESVGTILTIRNTMARPSRLSYLLKVIFVAAIALFMLNGWSFQMSYRDAVEIGFDYFKGGTVLVLVLEVCFYLTLPATICITMFALLTVFENIPGFEGKFGVEDEGQGEAQTESGNYQIMEDHDDENESENEQNENENEENEENESRNQNSEDHKNDDKHRQLFDKADKDQKSKDQIVNSDNDANSADNNNNNSKNKAVSKNKTAPRPKHGYLTILKMRLIFCSILFFPFFLNINEYFVILMTGSLISPCLGFAFPALAYNHHFSNLGKISKCKKVFNYLIMVVGLCLNLAAFVNTVMDGSE